jgi:hypothetical protein
MPCLIYRHGQVESPNIVFIFIRSSDNHWREERRGEERRGEERREGRRGGRVEGRRDARKGENQISLIRLQVRE